MRHLKILSLILITSFLCSCGNKESPQSSDTISYVVSDSLDAWCASKLSQSRIAHKEGLIKLMFLEEELNHLWKPSYDENVIQDMASKTGFIWQELPTHEGNRRWELSLPLQPEDSTYITPNNLLLYLFR